MRDCGEMGMGMSESWEIAGVRRTNPLSRKNGRPATAAFTARHPVFTLSRLLLGFAKFFAAAIGDQRSEILS